MRLSLGKPHLGGRPQSDDRGGLSRMVPVVAQAPRRNQCVVCVLLHRMRPNLTSFSKSPLTFCFYISRSVKMLLESLHVLHQQRPRGKRLQMQQASLSVAAWHGCSSAVPGLLLELGTTACLPPSSPRQGQNVPRQAVQLRHRRSLNMVDLRQAV